MKKIIKLIALTGFLISLIVFFGCKNDNLPEVKTLDVTEITQTSATSGGIITADEDILVFDKGVCWNKIPGQPMADQKTVDGTGAGSFVSKLSNLVSGTEYYVKAYTTTSEGTFYGNELAFTTLSSTNQIIADHSIVNKYDQIPQQYIDAVKKMWVSYAGESHAVGVRIGMNNLEILDPSYTVSTQESGTPEAYTTDHLRFVGATYGDFTYTNRWRHQIGEEDWFTNATAISRIKAGITYCNTHSLELAALGFCWCYDDSYSGNISASADPVYGCHWYGRSLEGPEGSTCWGLDAADQAITGNSVCVDTYLNATQEFIDYCAAQGYNTKIFFSTGPVEPTHYIGEKGYQASLKHQRIRDYVHADSTRILFDYADILCYSDDGKMSTDTWNGHTFPVIATVNYGDANIGHIGEAGVLRIAKAMWWMLARIAGWDGK